MNDTLLDAPGNTWVALRVINATHNLILTEYRGRLDPPTAEYANFTVTSWGLTYSSCYDFQDPACSFFQSFPTPAACVSE